MSDERYDYQQQLEEDRRRAEEEREHSRKWREFWTEWAKLPETQGAKHEQIESH